MMAGPSSSQGGVFDNPVAIADLAAALTTAPSNDLQRVLEERDVSLIANFMNYFMLQAVYVNRILVMTIHASLSTFFCTKVALEVSTN